MLLGLALGMAALLRQTALLFRTLLAPLAVRRTRKKAHDLVAFCDPRRRHDRPRCPLDDPQLCCIW